MRSPVSSRALGECNAIKDRGFSLSELTLSASWKVIPVLPISPFLARGRSVEGFSGLLPHCRLSTKKSVAAGGCECNGDATPIIKSVLLHCGSYANVVEEDEIPLGS